MNKEQLEIKLYELMKLENAWYYMGKDTNKINLEIKEVIEELKNKTKRHTKWYTKPQY